VASHPPDRALQDLWVLRLKARDPEALREVVHAFSERLTAVVYGILKDRDEVDDVVQETFTKAWLRIASFQGDSGLYTWLYRVAVNGCKDHMKHRRRRPAESLEALSGQPGEPQAAFASSDAPILEGIERRELRLRVRAAIARLPERFRTVLSLREIEGMAYQDIADVLGLSLGTVESRLFRARKRLRALLEEGPPAGRGASEGAA
jgi:RNA polymerase sigma-70 factor (ECF subfamily)